MWRVQDVIVAHLFEVSLFNSFSCFVFCFCFSIKDYLASYVFKFRVFGKFLTLICWLNLQGDGSSASEEYSMDDDDDFSLSLSTHPLSHPLSVPHNDTNNPNFTHGETQRDRDISRRERAPSVSFVLSETNNHHDTRERQREMSDDVYLEDVSMAVELSSVDSLSDLHNISVSVAQPRLLPSSLSVSLSPPVVSTLSSSLSPPPPSLLSSSLCSSLSPPLPSAYTSSVVRIASLADAPLPGWRQDRDRDIERLRERDRLRDRDRDRMDTEDIHSNTNSIDSNEYDSESSLATSLFVEVDSIDEDGSYTRYGAASPETLSDRDNEVQFIQGRLTQSAETGLEYRDGDRDRDRDRDAMEGAHWYPSSLSPPPFPVSALTSSALSPHYHPSLSHFYQPSENSSLLQTETIGNTSQSKRPQRKHRLSSSSADRDRERSYASAGERREKRARRDRDRDRERDTDSHPSHHPSLSAYLSRSQSLSVSTSPSTQHSRGTQNTSLLDPAHPFHHVSLHPEDYSASNIEIQEEIDSTEGGYEGEMDGAEREFVETDSEVQLPTGFVTSTPGNYSTSPSVSSVVGQRRRMKSRWRLRRK